MRQKTGVTALTITIIVLGVLYWYWTELIPRSMRSTAVPQGGGPAGENTIAKQLQELDALRAQFPSSSKTQADERRELDTLRKQLSLPAPTEADTARQLKELEQLRMSQPPH